MLNQRNFQYKGHSQIKGNFVIEKIIKFCYFYSRFLAQISPDIKIMGIAMDIAKEQKLPFLMSKIVIDLSLKS